MNKSLYFQIGLLFEKLRTAYLCDGKAILLSKDLRRILWVTPQAARCLGFSDIYQAMGASSSYDEKIVEAINTSLEKKKPISLHYSNYSADPVVFLAEKFIDFTTYPVKDSHVLQQAIEAAAGGLGEAVLLREETMGEANLLNLSALLYGIEDKAYVASLITNKGSMVSNLYYKNSELHHKICAISKSGEDVVRIADIFDKLRELIYFRDKPVDLFARGLIRELDDLNTHRQIVQSVCVGNINLPDGAYNVASVCLGSINKPEAPTRTGQVKESREYIFLNIVRIDGQDQGEREFEAFKPFIEEISEVDQHPSEEEKEQTQSLAKEAEETQSQIVEQSIGENQASAIVDAEEEQKDSEPTNNPKEILAQINDIIQDKIIAEGSDESSSGLKQRIGWDQPIEYINTATLENLFSETLAIAQKFANKYKVKIHHSFSRNLLPLPLSYQDAKTILLNLLENAIINNREGGSVLLAVRVSEYNQIAIMVHDTGMGIDYQNDKVISACRKFVESHAGVFGVNTQHGKGTTVSMIFDAVAEKATS